MSLEGKYAMKKQSVRSKRNVRPRKSYSKPRKKSYRISVLKAQDDYELNEVLDWINYNCSDEKFHYRDYKKNIVFTFYNIDDAFKFKFRWEISN